MGETYLDSLEMLLSQVVRNYNQQILKASVEIGIYPGQLPVLFILAKQDGMIQKELVSRLRIKPATVTVKLNQMENAGLIERRPDPDDLRASRVFMTLEGHSKLEHVNKIVKNVEEKCFEGFLEEEKFLLRRFLLHMNRNLEEL
ncbi:MarR family winged helix-turn-helix transcriptional regulator [Brevibacillus daliensis]|uniref:MarR family winged helix-turn-helix transcriptional regulator n=1 Tax=Brevibacillus daliensis TaxID=2892995 RepID=UPI001E55F571|nr:MarR family transcriptional regulator [Brevibacillus daliensis]